VKSSLLILSLDGNGGIALIAGLSNAVRIESTLHVSTAIVHVVEGRARSQQQRLQPASRIPNNMPVDLRT
jgi:hypothetical protein